MTETHDLRLAVLIDADNVSHNSIEAVMKEIAEYGDPTVKRIYSDWTSPQTQGWKISLLEYAITPVQQYGYTTGKNSTDGAMIIDAMDILYREQVDGFCIISSDSDFTRLVVRLRESGKKVFGFGEEKTPRPFVVACDKFIYIEKIHVSPEKAIATSDNNELARTPTKPDPGRNKKSEKQQGKPDSTMIDRIPLSGIELIANAIADIADDDGYVSLSNLGQLLSRKQPDFDSRNFGFSQLSKLIASITRFEIDVRDSQDLASKQIFVRDKQIPHTGHLLL